MAKFPVSFNFKAFENISRTIDSVGAKFDGLKTKVKGVNNKFRLMQMRTEAVRKSLGRMGNSLKSAGRTLSTFVTLPLAALGARFVKVSADAEETANKFKEVFKGVDAGAQTASVRRLTDEFKLSRKNAQDFLSTTGLIAKGLDLNAGQALDLSTKLASLSQDVASFRNVQGGAQQVVQAFNSALVGERERLKTLGIVITEADVKTKALQLAQQGQRFETIKQAKAFATLALIQDRTKDDLGDFARTINSFSNQLRVTSERFDEVSRVIGDILKPIAADILAIFNRIQSAFLKLSPSGQKIVVVIAALAAALGPLLVIVGGFMAFLPAMITGFSALAAVSTPVIAGVLAISAGVAGLIAGGVALMSNWEDVKRFFVALWDGPLVRFVRFITGLDMLIALGKLVARNWEPIAEIFSAIADAIGSVVSAVGGALGAIGKKILFGDNDPFSGPKETVAGTGAGGRSQAQEMGREFAREVRTTNDARVRVDFSNAPRGTRVRSESTGLPPELNMGLSGAPL